MLRALIVTGCLLMAVGFGAAGWQYWQTLPASGPEAATEPDPQPDPQSDPQSDPSGSAQAAPTPAQQSWLISPGGGLVAPDDVRAYLVQDRFVPGRTLDVLREASLTSLLADGEKLPEVPFLQVLADIRAPRVAEGLCAVLTETVAQDCAVNAARVVEGSVDPAAGTAMFRLQLVYRLKDAGTDLPDLATHVLGGDAIRLDLDAGAEGTATPDALLRAVVAAADQACQSDETGKACRPIGYDLDWAPGRPVSAVARIAWLDPLPKGMFKAPPLAPKG